MGDLQRPVITVLAAELTRLRAEVAKLVDNAHWLSCQREDLTLQVEDLRAALIRFTDLVDLPAATYTAKHGATTYADAMSDAFEAARVALASAATPKEER